MEALSGAWIIFRLGKQEFPFPRRNLLLCPPIFYFQAATICDILRHARYASRQPGLHGDQAGESQTGRSKYVRKRSAVSPDVPPDDILPRCRVRGLRRMYQRQVGSERYAGSRGLLRSQRRAARVVDH